jgi:predicted  nucleic acid-binding Zn-ribbon protein
VTEMCTACTAYARDGICRTCSRPCEDCECVEFYRDPRRRPPASRDRAQDATLTRPVPQGDGMDQDQPHFREADLAALIKEGVPPPVLMCGDLLYKGGLHSISGPPDCGKTTIALHWILRYIREGGQVMFLDEEGGAELTAEKLISLGATPQDAASIRYYPFPAKAWNAYDVVMLREAVDAIRPGIVLWDSSAAFLSRAGLDENSASDVTRFWSQVLTPVAREHGAAVLVVDHDTKNGEASRFARGSGAKLAASDVAFKVSIMQAFDRTTNGVLRLAVTKDRRGWLHRHWEVGIHVGPVMDIRFTETAEDGGLPAGADLSPAERKVAAALTGTPSTAREITDRIAAAHGHGLTRQTMSAALNKLLRLGTADKLDQGTGKPALWSVTQGMPAVIGAGQTCQATGPPETAQDLSGSHDDR